LLFIVPAADAIPQPPGLDILLVGAKDVLARLGQLRGREGLADTELLKRFGLFAPENLGLAHDLAPSGRNEGRGQD
jgi:hypothetical protein